MPIMPGTRQITQISPPGCIAAPLRRALDAVDRNMDILRPLTSGESSPDLNINIENLFAEDGSEPPAMFMRAIARVGTIGAVLTRDGTATLTPISGGGAAVTVYGYFVKSGYKIPSGSRVGAIRIGATWYAVVTDTCLVVA